MYDFLYLSLTVWQPVYFTMTLLESDVMVSDCTIQAQPFFALLCLLSSPINNFDFTLI